MNIITAQPRRGQIGYWRYLNAVSASGKVNDASVIGNTVTLVGNAVFDENGFNFHGDDSAAADSSTASFDINTPFTVSCFVKTSVTDSYPNIIGKRATNNATSAGWAFYIRQTTGYLGVNLRTSNSSYYLDAYVEVNIADNTLHHVLVTYSGNGLASGFTVYVDGTAHPLIVLQDSLNGASISNVVPLRFGGYGSSTLYQPYTGTVDDIRIYNKVLSVSQISELYTYGRGFTRHPVGISAADCLGWWSYAKSGIPGRLYDISGQNNHVILNGSAFVNKDGMVLNGAGDYGSLPTFANQTHFSICAWVKMSDNYRNCVIAKGIDTNQYNNLYLFTGTNRFWYFGVGDGSSYTQVVSNAVAAENVWTFVIGTYDGVTLKLYLNGVLESAIACSLTPYASPEPAKIGRWGTTSDFDFIGNIDGICCYNLALSAEISNRLYHQTRGRHW